MDVAEVLEKAADLIEPEGAWCQGSLGKTKDGYPVPEDSPYAVSLCAIGAILKASGKSWTYETYDYIHAVEAVVGEDLAVWNNWRRRTQAEVVSKLREAAKLARTGQS